ncbi:energy-coupled thiamine transporter ThiT [Alloiococcus sp. CFN-8]|uniref:energy-coupled thiamine transporter ThiT n=1 Tax=Alloiococcus sp. CFN-8 TaxID=3416081 RepID=UPI003CF0ACBD
MQIINDFLLKLQEMFQDLPGKLSYLFSKPSTIITIIALAVMLVLLVRLKKVKLNTKILVLIAVTVALSTILGSISLYRLPQGGSITLGSMVPILLLAFIYGPEVGFVGGLVYGILNLITGPYIIHPMQVLLDYPLPFMLLGTAGYFKNTYLGCTSAVFLRFTAHVLSGVIFFYEYAGSQNPWIYSIIYNGSYLLPELLITLVIFAALPLARLKAAAA